MVPPLWKTICGSSKKKSPYVLLGMYSKELKAGSQMDNCTPQFIAALFTIAKK